MPAKAGFQGNRTSLALDPRFRGGDKWEVDRIRSLRRAACPRAHDAGSLPPFPRTMGSGTIMKVGLGVALAVAALIGSAGQQASAAGPSFDCAKAGNWAEKAICKNDELAALDAWFGPLYGQVAQRLAGKDLDGLKARRKAWLKSRNDCKTEADGTTCMKTRYQEFTAELERQFAQLVGGDSGAKGAGAVAANSPLAECAGKADASACLEKLVEAEEANLTDAEAKAGDAAAQRDQADQNAHLADRLAEANVAWRAYRNTECKRRQQAGGDADATAIYSSCLVELTRVRVRELQL